MSTTQTFTGTLVVLHCYKCHAAFGITKDHYERAHTSGDSFWCPNGHSQVFSETEETRLKKELETARRRARYAEASREAAHDQAVMAERSARAYKGHVTRMKNKIANGVCPHPDCRRPFQQVAAHIKRMHPDWEHRDEVLNG